MAGSVRATLLGLLIQILCNGLAGQQLLLTRPQRSLFEDPLGHVEQVEHLPSLGWSGVGGGLGVGEWPYSTVGLGHMSKDELLTLLEAWKEVEEESATTTTAPPADATTRRPPPPPLPPPPPPPPRPIPVSVAMPAPALPPSGTPITVRLPAFVPVRLAAVFTPPASGQAGSAASSANEVGEAGGDDLATEEMPDDGVTTRLLRFLPMPRARTRPQSNSQNRQQFVVRNTLDSVDAGTAPVRQQVKPEVQPKATAPPSTPKFPGYPTPSFRPRFGVPPSLANARFELVPSSQIIGDWRV